jgi:hypothetical protein
MCSTETYKNTPKLSGRVGDADRQADAADYLQFLFVHRRRAQPGEMIATKSRLGRPLPVRFSARLPTHSSIA